MCKAIVPYDLLSSFIHQLVLGEIIFNYLHFVNVGQNPWQIVLIYALHCSDLTRETLYRRREWDRKRDIMDAIDVQHTQIILFLLFEYAVLCNLSSM